jgi:hypothetical protein
MDQAYECGITWCACDEGPTDVEVQCVEADGVLYPFACVDGFWTVESHGACATDDTRCYSPDQNVALALSGTIPGCDCVDDDFDCGVEGNLKLGMECAYGKWETRDGPPTCEGTAGDLCSSVGDASECESSSPVFATEFNPDAPSLGSDHDAPACSEGCPYRYDSTEDEWVPATELQCPTRDELQCDDALAELRVDAPCETADDCVVWGGVSDDAACGSRFVPPLLFVSALMSEGQVYDLRVAYDDLVAHGCGRDMYPDEGASTAACMAGVCSVADDESLCGLAPDEPLDAGPEIDIYYDAQTPEDVDAGGAGN